MSQLNLQSELHELIQEAIQVALARQREEIIKEIKKYKCGKHKRLLTKLTKKI